VAGAVEVTLQQPLVGVKNALQVSGLGWLAAYRLVVLLDIRNPNL
jgi:hypothetical protein